MTDGKTGIIRTDKGSQGIVRKSTADAFIEQLKQAEKIAEWVSKSKTFGRAFSDEEGNINTGDVVSAILLGNELGIPPMSAITLGRRLNADSYMKVMKGRTLGLDPVSALSLISIIPTKAGDVIHTGIHTITKVLIENQIKINILEDFVEVYKYFTLENKEVEFDIHKDKLFIIEKFTTKQETQDAKDSGKILVFRKLFTRRTTVKLERENHNPITISYTLQDAVDAGLYKGVSSDGETVEGKANWNYHPATMLRNRTITIGGRIIAADKLQGTYETNEAIEFTDYQEVDTTPDDVTTILKEEEERKQSESKSNSEEH